jgi:hypothetical protein
MSLDRGLVQQIARLRHNRLDNSHTHSKEGSSNNSLVASQNPTHAHLAGMESSSTLEAMKVIRSLNQLVPDEAPGHSTNRIARTPWHIRRRDSLPLREAIPLWFAISSPLIGLIIGFLGAWFVTWLTS